MMLSLDKRRNVLSISNSAGIVTGLAMDQRASLQSLFAQALGCSADTVAPELLVQFKSRVSEILTSRASAVLLDEQFGLPAMQLKRPNTALLMPYEAPYRPYQYSDAPKLLPTSVERMKSLGIHGVKLLAYYSPLADSETNARKQRVIEEVGSECLANNVAFILEVLSYDVGGVTDKPDYVKEQPELILHNAAEFSCERYKADVLKLEFPVHPVLVRTANASDGHFTEDEAMSLFRRLRSATQKPVVFLSGGMPYSDFLRGLDLAARSRTPFSGVLCGRAIWSDAIRPFVEGGIVALDRWLHTAGLERFEAVAEYLHGCTPLTEYY